MPVEYFGKVKVKQGITIEYKQRVRIPCTGNVHLPYEVYWCPACTKGMVFHVSHYHGKLCLYRSKGLWGYAECNLFLGYLERLKPLQRVLQKWFAPQGRKTLGHIF